MYTGEIQPRRILRLIPQLPEGSATAASMSGSREARGWTHDRWLARDQRQLTAALIQITLKANGAKRTPKIPDWPTPRPKPAASTRRLADMPGAIDIHEV